MYSLQDPNIFNLAVDGVFDDCQDIVKAVSNDLAYKAKYQIGTVNSINWGRVLAQVVYYFQGYLLATQSSSEKVSFTVPSGNFGNVCAGHIARMMGLPIERLVVATNENDVLDEFFRTGIYRARKSAETLHTSSPWIFPKPVILSVLFLIYFRKTVSVQPPSLNKSKKPAALIYRMTLFTPRCSSLVLPRAEVPMPIA
jgi:hypothetical protein